MDRRATPANGRVAALHLKGRVEAARFVEGTARQVAVSTTTIWRNTAAENPERQLLYGDVFSVLEDREGFAFGQSAKDGYCGYVQSTDLKKAVPASHIISGRSSQIYSGHSIKTPHLMDLSFGSRLALTNDEGRFLRTHDGHYVPRAHVREIDRPFDDPVAVAELFLGAPYLWGGNSSFGLDCSGLVQAALLACGTACPGDSDMQEQALGRPLPDNTDLRRGDLIFWKTHVAIVVDRDRLIHANAHSMSVAYEPIAATIARIEAVGEGRVTSRRRL